MCWKPECPHGGNEMCSCAELKSGKGNAMRSHFIKNLSGLKLELSYNTLTAPLPYCLCVAGTCKVCGGRLCMSIGMPAHLKGEGLLAVILHHAVYLDLKAPDQFVELFHKEDWPAVRQWLEED